MKKNIDAMNHPTKVKESIGERIYTIVVYLLLILISATIILPLLHIISGSFSDPMQLLTGKVSFWPKGFTTSMNSSVVSILLCIRAFTTHEANLRAFFNSPYR